MDYSDDEIRADGFDLPGDADFSDVQSGSSSAPSKPARGRSALGAIAQLGPFADEVIGGMSALGVLQMGRPLHARKAYRHAQGAVESTGKEFRKEHPRTSLGILLGSALLPAGAIGAASKVAGAGKLARVATSAPVVAGATGAAMGAGEGHGTERLTNALVGGGVGAVGGAVLSPVASATQKIFGPSVNRLMAKLPSRAGAARTVAPAQEKALQMVAQKLADDGVPIEQITDAIARAKAGDPELLLNLGGENVAALARTVQSLPGRGKTVIQSALDEQAVAVPELVSQGVEKAIGKRVPNVVARQQELTDAAASAAAPYYEALRQQAVHAVPGLDRVLKRPAVEEALGIARRNILNRGEALPDGATVGLLDDAKKVLDAQIEAIEDQITKGMASGADKATVRSLQSARDALVDAVDEATSGAYAKARQIAGEGIGQREAFREGAGALRSQADELTERVRGQTPAEQALGLEGASTDIVERLTARDPSRAASVFDPKTVRNLDILAQQLPKAREAIRGTYERASKIQNQARASTMRGQSTTSSTLAGQQELADNAAGTVLNALDPGNALTFGGKAIALRLLAKAYRLNARARLGKGSQEVADEIAKLLTRKLGKEVSQPEVLRLLNQAMTQQAVTKATKAGRRIAAGAISGTASSAAVRP